MLRARNAVTTWMVLVIGLAWPGATWAQDNALRDGAWALQFRIDQNFTLSSFKGSVVSLKHHLTDRSAVRLGVALSLDNGDSTSRSDSLEQTLDSDSHNVEFNVDWWYALHPEGVGTAFIAMGPLWGFSGSDRTTTAPTSVRVSEASQWRLGGQVALGAEWFATETIGIHAEYGLSLVFRSSETTVTSDTSGTRSVSTVDTDEWTLEGSRVQFGVSLYF